jgi:acyl-CoA synthetase (AMP-forming)/AMP-acid ligase II
MNRPHVNVTDFLLDGKAPDRIALQLVDEQHSYGELQSTAGQVSRYLLQIAGEKGERVILASDNSLFWVAAYLGTLWPGLVSIPLPPSIPPQEFQYILRATGARIVFAQAGFARRNRGLLRDVHLVTDGEVSGLSEPASWRSFDDLRRHAHDAQQEPRTVKAEDLAALMFTSGSTGQPRGVMVSHGNIIANTESIVQYLGLTENDRIMTVLPFHYCFGTSLLHTHLCVGGSLVIDSRFMYPDVVLRRMRETECTGFAGVPSHFQILLRKSSLRKNSFPRLRYVQQAGGHLAPHFVRELREALPNTQIFVMYGQTEATARLSYVPPELLEKKLGSIGKGIPGVKLCVLNESGEQVRAGEVGEIVAEGENIARGYWGAPRESAASFCNGRLYTGDLATVDEDGFIFIVDRAKDFMKCGGKRVSCRQLEERILEFEGLVEAAVIGVPDEVLGEAVKVFVVPRDVSCTELKKPLLQFCKECLPPQLVPREIVVLQRLPKNSSGKVLKQALRAGLNRTDGINVMEPARPAS